MTVIDSSNTIPNEPLGHPHSVFASEARHHKGISMFTTSV